MSGRRPQRGGGRDRGGSGGRGDYSSRPGGGHGPSRQTWPREELITRGDGGAEASGNTPLISYFEVNRKPKEKQVFSQADGGIPIDTTVKSIEGQYELKTAKDLSKLSLSGTLPYRPGYGTQGRPVQVFANFFVVKTPPKLILTHYSIGTPGELATKKAKRREVLVRALDRLPGWATLQRTTATDFAQMLVVAGQIPEIENAPLEKEDEAEADSPLVPTLTINVPDMREDGTEVPNKSWNVKFRLVKKHNIDNILSYLSSPTGPQNSDGDKFDSMQVFNVFLGHHARVSDDIFLKSNGQRNKMWHRRAERLDLLGGIEAIKGFISSIRYATGRILLNVNNAAIAGYRAINLLTSIDLYRNNRPYYEAEGFIKALKIRRNWLDKQSRPKDKSVWGFAHKNDGTENGRAIEVNGKKIVMVNKDFAGSRDVKFLLDGGTYITVFEFFKKTHPRFVIKQPDAPLVNIGSKAKPVYAPAELCTIVDGQDYRKKLGGKQTQDMLDFAVNQPWLNFRYIEARAPPILGINSAMLNAANITIQNRLIKIDARVLQPPTVKYQGGKSASVSEGGWAMTGKGVMKAVSLPLGWKFLVIVGPEGFPLSEKVHELAKGGAPLAVQFVERFVQELEKIGIRVPKPNLIRKEIVHLSGDAKAYDQAIKNLFIKYRDDKFLFMALPLTLPDWQYKRIKYYGDVVFGITTVCISSEKIMKNYYGAAHHFSQYCANIGLKVNIKLGGNNQAPDPAKLKPVTDGRVMLVGLDVTHPAPGSKDTAQSVAAMVANVDRGLGQWPAHLELNDHRREDVKVVEKMMLSRFDLWKKKNEQYPQYIMVFRDGVSEGQFQMVLQKELPQIKEAIKKTYKNPKMQPSVFVAVCGKRHQVRFAPTTLKEADAGSNCFPGLVVDRGITETRIWDFYLQAHKAIQGTARSCHYTVLHDEIFSTVSGMRDFGRPGMSKADVLQDFCNALAYTYPRATKAVSLSTPAKLADLACDRARAYVSNFIDSTTFDDNSSVSSGANDTAANEQQAAIKVHDNLKNTMFYI